MSLLSLIRHDNFSKDNNKPVLCRIVRSLSILFEYKDSEEFKTEFGDKWINVDGNRNKMIIKLLLTKKFMAIYKEKYNNDYSSCDIFRDSFDLLLIEHGYTIDPDCAMDVSNKIRIDFKYGWSSKAKHPSQIFRIFLTWFSLFMGLSTLYLLGSEFDQYLPGLLTPVIIITIIYLPSFIFVVFKFNKAEWFDIFIAISVISNFVLFFVLLILFTILSV